MTLVVILGAFLAPFVGLIILMYGFAAVMKAIRKWRWNKGNRVTCHLHVKLDPSDGIPRSAQVTKGAFKDRDVLDLTADEFYEFRKEAYASGDGQSVVFALELKNKVQGNAWDSRLQVTEHFLVLLNKSEGKAIRATFRFGKGLIQYEGREITDLTFEEIRQYRSEFARRDGMAETILRDILELPTETKPTEKPQPKVTVFTGLTKMSLHDAHEILGIGPEASAYEVKQRQRVLQQQLHHEKGGTNRLAQLVNDAARRLSDAIDAGHRGGQDHLPFQAQGMMSLREAAEILGLTQQTPIRKIRNRAQTLLGRTHPNEGGSVRLDQLVSQASALMRKHNERKA